MKPEVERCGEEAIRLDRVKKEEEDVIISGARCQRRVSRAKASGGRGCPGGEVSVW
jgi:hypothetical protein